MQYCLQSDHQIIANRIELLISNIIHPTQINFIEGRKASDSVVYEDHFKSQKG